MTTSPPDPFPDEDSCEWWCHPHHWHCHHCLLSSSLTATSSISNKGGTCENIISSCHLLLFSSCPLQHQVWHCWQECGDKVAWIGFSKKGAVTRWHGLDTWGGFGNIIPSFQVALSNTRCEWHFWQECDDYVAWIGHWIGSKKSGDTVAWIGFSKKGGASPNIFPSTLWCCHLHRRVISATKYHKRQSHKTLQKTFCLWRCLKGLKWHSVVQRCQDNSKWEDKVV